MSSHVTTRYRLRHTLAVGIAVAIASICLALATAAASTATPASPRSTHARQLHANIRKLESTGYVPRACTTHGLQMFNPRTGRVATIKY